MDTLNVSSHFRGDLTTLNYTHPRWQLSELRPVQIPRSKELRARECEPRQGSKRQRPGDLTTENRRRAAGWNVWNVIQRSLLTQWRPDSPGSPGLKSQGLHEAGPRHTAAMCTVCLYIYALSLHTHSHSKIIRWSRHATLTSSPEMRSQAASTQTKKLQWFWLLFPHCWGWNQVLVHTKQVFIH